ncbi:3227_t:CDS:2, partial [Paraglomus brasilianum]
AENAKLKQIIEENAKREAENINLKMELEKNKKDITYLSAENSELKIKVAKLSCDFEEIKSKGMITDSPEQLSISEKKIVSVSTFMENSSVTPEQIDVQTGDVSASDISVDTSNSDDIPTKEISPLNESQPDKEEAITPDPITGIEHSSTQVQKTESSTTSLSQNITDDDTDETLDFVEMKHKEHVSKEIMERIREKKLRDQNSSLDSTLSEPSYENQNLESSIISQSISNSSELSSDNNSSCDSESKSPTNIPEFSIEVTLTGSSEVTAENIADLFNIAMKTRQKEILCWYYYYKAYENRVRNIKTMDKIDDKSARTLVYNEIKSLLPDVTDVNLRKITFRAKRVYILFEGIGIDKISQASAISSLKDVQIQNIIIDFSKSTTMNENRKVISVPNWNAHVTEQTLPETDVSVTPTPPILSSNISSHYVTASEDKEVEFLPETKISAVSALSSSPSNLTYDCDYFRNKILGRYPDIYREFNSKKFDYYGIIDKSLCPACKLSHKDEKSIRGRYEAGSYFIKCGQQEIEITASQTDKICSRLYKAYMEETGLDPWIKSETSESPQSENADNHIMQDSSLETQVMAPNKICTSSISKTDPNKNRLYQYAIEHGMNPKKFSIITEAEKNRWNMGCFRGDLERDIHFYRGGIERKEDPRKYRKF